MRKVLLIFLVAGLLLVFFFWRGEEEFPYTFAREWLKKGNVWVFDEPPLEYLREVGATGTVWSVYFAGVNEHDKEYVNRLHRNGSVVCSGPPTAQSNTTDNEQLKGEACERDIYGQLIHFLGLEQCTMCGNHPLWREFLMKRFEEHVLGGVDAILIDEIGDTGKFCDRCMEVFNSYLAEKYTPEQLRSLFGIENILSFNYRLYLLEHGATDYWGDPNPLLQLEYLKAKRLARVKFIGELVAHTKQVAGREVLMSGNLYGLYPDEIIYLPYLDFVIFEMSITSPTGSFTLPLPGKHLTTYLLGEAAAPDKPFTGFPDVFDLAGLSEEEWWLWRCWLAEARSCGASFLLPYQAYTHGGGSYTIPADKISPYTRFFAEHPQYYENLERVATVAVLYDLHSTLVNRYTWMANLAWESFENVGLVLQDAHLPFEVVYRGDGEFMQEPLTLEKLQEYRVVVIPRYYDLDAEVENLLSLYSSGGGRVVRCDTLSSDSLLVPTLRGTGVDLGVETDAPSDLGMMLYRGGDSLLLHLLNYRYDRGRRDFSDLADLTFTLTLPEGVSLEGKTLKLVSPDAAEQVLEFRLENGKATFTVPVLHCYSVVSFE